MKLLARKTTLTSKLQETFPVMRYCLCNIVPTPSKATCAKVMMTNVHSAVPTIDCLTFISNNE